MMRLLVRCWGRTRTNRPCLNLFELHDLVEDMPPIPYSAWPARWSVSDGEGGQRLECEECGEPLDDAAIREATGLPDYPWREKGTPVRAGAGEGDPPGEALGGAHGGQEAPQRAVPAEYLNVACPFCGAVEGEPCRPHRSREAAARAAAAADPLASEHELERRILEEQHALEREALELAEATGESEAVREAREARERWEAGERLPQDIDHAEADPEEWLHREWEREHGPDPEGPPVGWRPSSRRRRSPGYFDRGVAMNPTGEPHDGPSGR